MNFDHCSILKRVFILNAIAAIGVVIGFISASTKISPEYGVPAVVFFLAYLNFSFLVLRPRILTAKSGASRASIFSVIGTLWRERPSIILLVILQLVAVSRSATVAVSCFQASMGEYVHHLENAAAAERMALAGILMTVVALIWLFSAVGLWNKRRWAWWLAVVLNGLAAAVSALVQLLNFHSYLFDAMATFALVLLLLPTVRKQFGTGRGLNAVASSPAG